MTNPRMKKVIRYVKPHIVQVPEGLSKQQEIDYLVDGCNSIGNKWVYQGHHDLKKDAKTNKLRKQLNKPG